MASRVLSLRVSEAEAEEIQRRAARLGMPVAHYLRRCALPPTPVAIPGLSGAGATTTTLPDTAHVIWKWTAV